MDKMREEFECWAKSQFDIDCYEMSFGVEGNDKREQYHNDDDPDGAITVSAMFYAWKASRAELCVELPDNLNGEYYADGWNACLMRVEEKMKDAGVSYK
jgi:hypothetical protein